MQRHGESNQGAAAFSPTGRRPRPCAPAPLFCGLRQPQGRRIGLAGTGDDRAQTIRTKLLKAAVCVRGILPSSSSPMAEIVRPGRTCGRLQRRRSRIRHPSPESRTADHGTLARSVSRRRSQPQIFAVYSKRNVWFTDRTKVPDRQSLQKLRLHRGSGLRIATDAGQELSPKQTVPSIKSEARLSAISVAERYQDGAVGESRHRAMGRSPQGRAQPNRRRTSTDSRAEEQRWREAAQPPLCDRPGPQPGRKRPRLQASRPAGDRVQRPSIVPCVQP